MKQPMLRRVHFVHFCQTCELKIGQQIMRLQNTEQQIESEQMKTHNGIIKTK